MMGFESKINEEESLSEFSWELGNITFFCRKHCEFKEMDCDVTLQISPASEHIYTSWHTRGGSLTLVISSMVEDLRLNYGWIDNAIG